MLRPATPSAILDFDHGEAVARRSCRLALIGLVRQDDGGCPEVLETACVHGAAFEKEIAEFEAMCIKADSAAAS